MLKTSFKGTHARSANDRLVIALIGVGSWGTNLIMEAAALKYKELDGKVDAFGVGGAASGNPRARP